MTRSVAYLGLAALVLAGGAVGLLGQREKPLDQSRHQSPEPTSVDARGALVPAASNRVTPSASAPHAPDGLPSATLTAPDSRASDERALMSRLRELRGSNPSLSLELARDGNQRFGDSPDAAERSWVIVKSLSDLGRHDEARVEGRALLERYRDTSWGEDVYRHLFVNPPTHPFERGYGKQLELE